MCLESDGQRVRSPFGGSECSGVGLNLTGLHQLRNNTSPVLFHLLGTKISHDHPWTRQMVLIGHQMSVSVQKR